jgi:hypothetical protein
MIGADCQQAGKLALGTGIRLERDRVITGDLAQRMRELGNQQGLALRL